MLSILLKTIFSNEGPHPRPPSNHQSAADIILISRTRFARNRVTAVAEGIQTTGHVVFEADVAPLPPEGSDKLGGQLKTFAQVWCHFFAHPRIVKVLSEGYLLPFKIRPKLSKKPLILSHYRDEAKEIFLKNAVSDLLKKGAITRVQNLNSPGFYSRLFLVPKPNNKWRPVIDLSLLNHHLHIRTFKMETAEVIRKSLKKGEWLASIDIKDAYLHVPMHQKAQKYLRFQTKQGVFQFVSLPFGIATAPYEFTILAKEVKLLARQRGINMHQYLDDWLVRAHSKEQCLQDLQNLIGMTQTLGWLVNFEKSELHPTQKLDFLGYNFDLEQGLVFPTAKNLEKLTLFIASFRAKRTLSARQLMSFIGLLVSLEKTVPLGRLHIRPFQWHLKMHWKYPQTLETPIPISADFLRKVEWWESPQNVLQGAPLHPLESTLSLFTDASMKGWGAHLGDQRLHGTWSDQERTLHINLLELKAAFLALKGFESKLKRQVVLLCSDNSSVVAYLNKQGGTKSLEMSLMTWRILSWCTPREILVRARHVPGSLNLIADSLSRVDKVIQTEWSLHTAVFERICQTWHYPDVDMFATFQNNKLRAYISPIPDQRAWKVDALSISWDQLDGYAYCPIAILPQLVQKMWTYPCRMIVVAPGWPGMAWFWDLVDLSTKPPLKLPLWKTLLKQPHNSCLHRNLEYLNLHAWHLDTRRDTHLGSRPQWKVALELHRDSPVELSTQLGGPFLGHGVARTRWMSHVHL